MALVKKPSKAGLALGTTPPPGIIWVSATSSRGVLSDPAVLVKLRWSMEQPRRRTVFVAGMPRRVEFRRPLVFLTVTQERDTLFPARYLFAWSGGEPGRGVLTPSTPLFVSSVHAPGQGATHVYANGVVCFGNNAVKQLQSKDPIDVFWGSSMTVLPRWMTLPNEKQRVEHEQLWPPAKITYRMSDVVNDDYTDFRYSRAATPYTPEQVTRDLIKLQVRAPSASKRNNIVGFEVTAPWLVSPEYYDGKGNKE